MFSPEHLQILSTMTWLGFLLVFLAGLTMAFNPRSLTIIPVIMGYLAGPTENKTFGRAFAFVLGMTAADVGLGVLFAYVGRGNIRAEMGARNRRCSDNPGTQMAQSFTLSNSRLRR